MKNIYFFAYFMRLICGLSDTLTTFMNYIHANYYIHTK